MKILIACEYSGTVRDAFSLRGHDAWSCDIIPTESEQTRAEGKHIQRDVLEVINEGWDMMIGHPPCNYISYAGTHVWNNPGRVFKRLEALMFFAKLWEAPIEKICLENPKSCASPVIAKYSQEIQPFQFGDAEMKTTWLWLKGLPLLQHTHTHTHSINFSRSRTTATSRRCILLIRQHERKKGISLTDQHVTQKQEPNFGKESRMQWLNSGGK